jgi:hypothetical protein
MSQIPLQTIGFLLNAQLFRLLMCVLVAIASKFLKEKKERTFIFPSTAQLTLGQY